VPTLADRTSRLPYDPVFEDRSLPHQIRLGLSARHGQALTVGCRCHRGPIAAKKRWEPGEALALYRSYHDGRNCPPGPLPDGGPARF
jgi:hypothetical protein